MNRTSTTEKASALNAAFGLTRPAAHAAASATIATRAACPRCPHPGHDGRCHDLYGAWGDSYLEMGPTNERCTCIGEPSNA